MSTKNFETYTLRSNRVQHFFAGLSGGGYKVEYRDSTHSENDAFTPLLSIDLSNSLASLRDGSDPDWDVAAANPSYKVLVEPKPPETNKEENQRVLLDQLAQCFVRSGLLLPMISKETVRMIAEIQKQKSVLVIPDTNALSNGSLHWLLSALPDTSTQLVPITISMHQIQEHDRRLKSQVNKHKPTNLKSALRSRSLANNSLSMLDLCPQNYQILEVPPELLRYVRPSSSRVGEQDETDVLEDRLLIEAIHQILRATRSKSPKFVITGDVTLARILHSEAIPFMAILVPILESGTTLNSVNFDPIARRFRGASLPQLIWTLLQTFSEVRITDSQDLVTATMSLYWKSKTADDWINHRFLFEATGFKDSPKISARESQGNLDVPSFTPPEITPAEHLSTLAAPHISFLPIVQLSSFFGELPLSLKELTARAEKKFGISATQTLNAGEFLLQAGLIEWRKDELIGSKFMTNFANCLDQNDLDGISQLIENLFPPYKALKSHLIETGILPAEITPEIKKIWTSSSKFAYRSLRPFLIYLGQAWTFDNITQDGTARSTDDTFIKAVLETFSDKDLLSIRELILGISRRLHMSPWAVSKKLEEVSSNSLLASLRFDPATASDTAFGDKILRGPLLNPTLEPLPISSIYVGGKPIFTVARA